ADTVEPFRVDFLSIYEDKPEHEGKPRIGGFVITASGKPLGKEFAQKLSAILLEAATYQEASAKCFEPGVAFRLRADQRSAEVLICFMCNDINVRPNRKGNRDASQLADFGQPVRVRLLKLTKEAFPDDEQIQNLKADKSHE